MAAYYSAVRAGVSAVEFWALTPYLTRQAVIARSDGTTIEAWSIGAMTRARKLPALHSLLLRTAQKEDPEPKILEGNMKALFKSINKQNKGKR
jgi:hypothetical protein